MELQYNEVAIPSPIKRNRKEESKLDENTKLWSVHDGNFFPASGVTESVPSGQYTINHSMMRGTYLSAKPIEMDEFVDLPDDATAGVLASMEYFWTRKAVFDQFGFLWKRGILLWGPPGSGKTSTLQRIAQQVINLSGIAIYCEDPDYTADGLGMIRKIEPERPIVVMMEDIDTIIENHGETSLLAMLDGELQVDNVVFIATTNYPENLDARFSNRPSRFDEVVFVGFPDDQSREAFFRQKNPRLSEDQDELNRWVSATEDFSVAALKETIIAVECLGQDLGKVCERLKKMMGKPISSEDYK